MAYIFKQKLQIQDLVDYGHILKRVLIHEPEEYLSAIYTQYLKADNFEVQNCSTLEALKELAKSFTPDILVFNIEYLNNPNVVGAWLLNFRKDFPYAAVITIGFNDNSENLKKLMSVGISSHINRKHTRPQDLAVIVKNILQI
jgi:DNA-binding response OmpR family regulator